MQAYLDWSRGNQWPVGTSLVEEHLGVERGSPDSVVPPAIAKGVLYVMERQTEGWRYLVVSDDGVIEYDSSTPSQTGDPVTGRSRSVAARGSRDHSCAECHSQATSDGVFGPPRE